MINNLTFPRPKNFQYKDVFYSDGNIALMFGTYKKATHQSLGMRWMRAEGNHGYPVSRGKKMWMVVPEKLALYILEGIFKNIDESEFILDRNEFEKALRELRGRNQ